ncbi:MAG: hypothetical protein WBD81_17960 [Collimonas pratensis]|uniref:hypothetical protein n=1 Tax=Collimonas pratensis TaxID=279113 RepID=UPI003C770968
MRWEFQKSLHSMMERDERTFLIFGDVGLSLFKSHIADFPKRVLNFGLAEQSMISFAAGMAMRGFRPICYSILPFMLERAFEQIKIDVDQMKLPVGIVGHSDSSCGPTHEEVCAGTMMALLPNIEKHFPATIAGMKTMMNNVNLDAPWFVKLSTVKEGA